VASRRAVLQQVVSALVGLLVGLAALAGAFWAPSSLARLVAVGVVLSLSSLAWIVVLAFRWRRPTRLVLAPDALVIEQALKDTQRLRWADVESFYVDWGERPDTAASGELTRLFRPFAVPKSGVVSYKLELASRLDSLAIGSDAGFGRAAALPADDFQQSATALAAALNDYRSRALFQPQG
jgi:hypothetical protein